MPGRPHKAGVGPASVAVGKPGFPCALRLPRRFGPPQAAARPEAEDDREDDPEPEGEVNTDFAEPDTAGHGAPSKDPFGGKRVIIETDKMFNHALTISTLGTYKEFLSLEGHYYFPGFDPMTGQDKVMKFIDNEGISISAVTVNGGRSTSNDLAYTYGKARIQKGSIVSNYNYVRIWELDKSHKWNVLLEAFSAIENE